MQISAGLQGEHALRNSPKWACPAAQPKTLRSPDLQFALSPLNVQRHLPFLAGMHQDRTTACGLGQTHPFRQLLSGASARVRGGLGGPVYAKQCTSAKCPCYVRYFPRSEPPQDEAALSSKLACQ